MLAIVVLIPKANKILYKAKLGNFYELFTRWEMGGIANNLRALPMKEDLSNDPFLAVQ
jgi:hypothetical protein